MNWPEPGFSLLAYQSPYYWLFTVWIFLLGAVVGSFLNVVIWRVPRGESIVFKPSHCPACHYLIRWYHNIPIFSWLWLRGRCVKCGAHISPRYLFVEALTGGLFLLCWLHASTGVQWPWRLFPTALVPGQMIAFMVLASLLVAVTFVDIDHRLIPPPLTVAGLVLAAVLAVTFPASHEYAWAPQTIEDLRHKPITYGFIYLINYNWSGFFQHLRLISLLDLALGVVFGGGFFWLICEIGKVFFGKRRITCDAPLTMTLTGKGFTAPEPAAPGAEPPPKKGHEDPDFVPWEDVFTRDSDRMVVYGQVLAVKTRRGKPIAVPPAPADEQTPALTVSEEHVTLGGEDVPWERVKEVIVRTQRWVEPQEAMGMGDAHVMAVVGAFLGPGACLMVLCLSTLLGAACGLTMMLTGRGHLQSKLPFGPYIAVATLAYMFWGQEILHGYVVIFKFIMFYTWGGGAAP